MKNLKPFIFLLVSIFLLMACKEEQSGGNASLIDKCSVIATREVTEAGDTVVVCDMAKVKEKVTLPLSQLVDSLELIRLESIDTAMVGTNILSIDLTDNYIGINSTYSYKLFARNGKYLRDIGQIGQGPGEYVMIYYSQIDEAYDRIYLLPWDAFGILVYDLQGNFIEKISLPYMVPKGVMKIDTKSERVSVVKLPWGEDDSPTVWVQDFNGKVLQGNRAKHLDVWPDYSSEVFCERMKFGDRNNFYFSSAIARVDSLYQYFSTENRCIPIFSTAFTGEVPFHSYYEFSNHYLVKVLLEDKFYPDNLDYCVFVDKSTLRGGLLELSLDMLGGVQLPLNYKIVSDFENFIYYIEPGMLLSSLEEMLQYKRNLSQKEIDEITDFMHSISEDDNNYLLLGKWK